MTEKITCPRRMNDYGPWQRKQGLDQFLPGHGLVGQNLGCSFCGSMEPQVVLDWMLDGAILSPTDKNYKMYVAKKGERNGKFYFYHFDVHQQTKFVELYNMRQRPFEIAYPGYFYVLPFFCRVQPEQE